MVRKRSLFAVIVILLCSGVYFGGYALAAESGKVPNTIGVSPALQNLTVRSGQRSVSYDVTLTNTSTSAQSVSLGAADFTSFAGTGQVKFLNPNTPNKDHGLANSFQLIAPQILLNPGESRAIPISLINLDKLTPGGHYGAVLFKTNAPNAQQKNNVTITQTVASLVFLTTEGEGSYKLTLKPQDSSFAWLKLPHALNMVFDNTGNVQATPRGYITVTGPSGFAERFVSKAVLNPDSALVLPGTQRLLQTTLPNSSVLRLPGIYTVRTYYKYEGANDYTFQVYRVIYFNILMLITGVVLIAIVAGIIWRFDLMYFVKKCVQRVIHR